MIQLINDILTEFRDCFKRQRAWKWFNCLIMGFMLRAEHRGATSTITALRLRPSLYHTSTKPLRGGNGRQAGQPNRKPSIKL